MESDSKNNKGGETMEKNYNKMCTDCGHLTAGRCSGTTAQFWTGCCGKNLSPTEFNNYVTALWNTDGKTAQGARDNHSAAQEGAEL